MTTMSGTINEIEWGNQSEFPGELNGSHQGLSVDVLVYSKQIGEHTVGWYDFNVMTWRFLVREPFVKFEWRYFHNEIDKPIKKTKG